MIDHPNHHLEAETVRPGIGKIRGKLAAMTSSCAINNVCFAAGTPVVVMQIILVVMSYLNLACWVVRILLILPMFLSLQVKYSY